MIERRELGGSGGMQVALKAGLRGGFSSRYVDRICGRI
jgi:hypothetical protein